MKKLAVSLVLAGVLLAGALAQAALSSGQKPAANRANGVQLAGYWGYANCVAGKRAWQAQHGMLGWSMLSPVMIGTAASCFEAF